MDSNNFCNLLVLPQTHNTINNNQNVALPILLNALFFVFYGWLISEFLLEELKCLCEHSARKIVSVANVAKMLLAAERYQGETLKAACLTFVQKNMLEVCRYPAFEAEVSVNPKLSMFILQGMVSVYCVCFAGTVRNKSNRNGTWRGWERVRIRCH